MAGDVWKPVVFNEGAPFDPNDLNQLQTNITQSFQQGKDILRNLLIGTDQSLLLAAGTSETKSVPANTATSFNLGRDSKFGSGIPTYVVSIGSPIPNGTIMSVGIINPDTNPQAVVVSNKAATGVFLNFIAFAIK
jgi:hypothetical protein